MSLGLSIGEIQFFYFILANFLTMPKYLGSCGH